MLQYKSSKENKTNNILRKVQVMYYDKDNYYDDTERDAYRGYRK